MWLVHSNVCSKCNQTFGIVKEWECLLKVRTGAWFLAYEWCDDFKLMSDVTISSLWVMWRFCRFFFCDVCDANESAFGRRLLLRGTSDMFHFWGASCFLDKPPGGGDDDGQAGKSSKCHEDEVVHGDRFMLVTLWRLSLSDVWNRFYFVSVRDQIWITSC